MCPWGWRHRNAIGGNSTTTPFVGSAGSCHRCKRSAAGRRTPIPREPAWSWRQSAILTIVDAPGSPAERRPGSGAEVHHHVARPDDLPASGGAISAEHRAETGKALCIRGDAGWGELVRRGKYRDGRFADDLVHACADPMAQWAPWPAPAWVTCIPSRRHPHLVPDFADRLAAEMGLAFHHSLSKIEDRAERKSMANSVQQARNVDGSLALSLDPLPGGPVLLVDDMVDSRWTLTVAAWLLRSNGSGAVWPFALAVTGQGR